MPVTVSLVEGNHELRGSFTRVLTGVAGLRLAGIHGTAGEAVRLLPLAPPDVALVDINLPDRSGIDCVAKLKAQMPEMQIVMLTLYEQDELIFDALRAGATGCLPKYSPTAEFIRVIKQVHAGGAPMSMGIARKVLDYFPEEDGAAAVPKQLTARERQILELLTKGVDDRETGHVLGISHGAVQTQVHGIYQKLHVESGVLVGRRAG